MKVTEVMFAELAAQQYAHKFNQEFNTSITVSYEIKEGTPFVTVDFGATPKELIFKFGYELGKIQKRLMKTGGYTLPVDQYPFPPEE